MKLTKIKTIEIGEETDKMTFHIKITNRAMIEYEAMCDSDLSAIKGTENLLKLMYCTSKAGAKTKGEPFDITFEQFLDITDEYYLEIVIKFGEALEELGGGGKKLLNEKLI